MTETLLLVAFLVGIYLGHHLNRRTIQVLQWDNDNLETRLNIALQELNKRRKINLK